MNRSKKQLMVKVSSLEKSLAAFKNMWERVEQGEQFETPIEILSFENAVLLLKTLSPKRLELLQKLHQLGKVSIRQLAKQLERDYSNVHQDVKSLCQIGALLEDNGGKYYVPWDSIITEIPLGKERMSKHHNYQYRHGDLGRLSQGI